MKRVKCINLPEDLIIEILYWLPVVSLLRCSSVCKSWRSIISGPEFIRTHSYRSKIMAHKIASVLMLTKCQLFKDICQSSPDFDYYLLDPSYYIVIGSCNGIICLKDDNFFHLWNPATKQGKRLPTFPKIEEDLTHAEPSVKLAFGLDAISNDYKIIKFVCPSPTITTNVVPVVQLYSTHTGSYKEIHVHDTSPLNVLCYPYLELGPVIKGVLYMGRKGQLVSFNLHNEMFSVFSFPSSMLRYSEVLDFEGSVAVIAGSFGEGSGISIWTMDDIPGKVSWTKKFFVRDDIRWAYSYLGGGLLYGRIPCNNGGGKSADVLYAYIEKEFKLPDENPSAVLKYRETLVSIEGFHPVRKIVDWFKPRVEQV